MSGGLPRHLRAVRMVNSRATPHSILNSGYADDHAVADQVIESARLVRLSARAQPDSGASLQRRWATKHSEQMARCLISILDKRCRRSVNLTVPPDSHCSPAPEISPPGTISPAHHEQVSIIENIVDREPLAPP
jgi:hypothetical protein